MEYYILVIAVILSGLSGYFFKELKSYVNSYLKEKGKNKAHIEDDRELTRIKEDSRHVQDIKRNAILKSLCFIDLYYSWLSWLDDQKTQIIPARESITSVELTRQARECYNHLVLSCEKEIIEKFLKIVFSSDQKLRQNGSSPTQEYNEFRNLARKELNLDKIELDEKKAFISNVCPEDLSKCEKK